MTQQSQVVGVDLRHPDGHVDEVAHEVVRRDVIRPHGRIAGGPAPVLPSPELDVAVLVRLDDGEGDGREDVAGRVLLQDVHPLCVT